MSTPSGTNFILCTLYAVPDTGNSLPAHASGGHGHAHGLHHIPHDPHASRKTRLRKRVSVMILDMGIAVHSIIIGLTLGVQESGSTFTTLLVALCFHQFFEVCFCCAYCESLSFTWADLNPFHL